MNLDKIHSRMNTSDYYSMREGSNRMRIVTDFVEVQSINRGKDFKGYVSENNQPLAGDTVRTQAWAWAIIRGDAKKEIADELNIVKFGKTILGQLVGLKNNPEYAFEDMPMPFDLDVQAKNAGEMTVVYTVVPARKNTEVTADEMEKLNKKNPITEIVKRMLEKQDSKGKPDQLNAYGNPSTPVDYPQQDDSKQIPF